MGSALLAYNNVNSRSGSAKDLDYNFIKQSGVNLFSKLRALKVANVRGLSDYNCYFLKNYSWLSWKIQMYSYLLWLALKDNRNYRNTTLVDYGGGLGILSLLAKEIKLNTVIFNDIDSNTCHDAQLLGESIKDPADHYVCGDIDTLTDFISSNKINCNTLISYDVLEHIYDIESYLKKLEFLSKGPLQLVMCSGANQYNPYLKHSIVKRQHRIEQNGRIGEDVTRNNDCKKSYYAVRVEIIKEYFPQLDNKTITMIAERTRGMRKNDILNVTAEYVHHNKIPSEVRHPSNTCDPFSGNWEEHLMDPFQLKNILQSHGFKVNILSGLRFAGEKKQEKILVYILNIPIRITKNSSLMLPISPFYTIIASRNVQHIPKT